jgi:arylformamidase
MEDGVSVIVSHLNCDVHSGTHIDAPWHFLEQGATIDKVSLDALVGPARVVHLPDVDVITADDLDNLKTQPELKRLLIRTRNSELWRNGVTDFRKDFVALSADAARWIVDHDFDLIGIDYLSVQRYGDDSQTHKILLSAGVVILEGLNLAYAKPGVYELICLPLHLMNAEGAPARAILRPLLPTQ